MDIPEVKTLELIFNLIDQYIEHIYPEKCEDYDLSDVTQKCFPING